MRFESFKPEDQKPLGVGEDKETFVNPGDDERVISVIKEKEGWEKNTPNKLKGAFYLTKIAHLLLPNHIPEIYQAGISADGKQTFDRERVSHTPGHELLQKERLSGGDTGEAKKIMLEEMGKEMSEVETKLGDIGFGFNIDENAGNYSKDEKGNVYYLETFMPWRTDDLDQSKLELLFGEEDLREAIERLSDQDMKKTCEDYLDRLLELFEEEKIKQKNASESAPGASEQEIQMYEALITAFEKKHNVDLLFAIKTQAEALQSEERTSAKNDLTPILDFLNKNESKIASEQHAFLFAKYKRLSQAVGMINSGIVDHER
ncbi:MAG: hypothetical protein WCT19_01970 [Candidatus Paceibacterota bacterium]|jgi:hypothetical protein